MKVNITKIHKFVPTNYRPTIIFDKDGKQLTTSELETLSTIEDIKGFKDLEYSVSPFPAIQVI